MLKRTLDPMNCKIKVGSGFRHLDVRRATCLGFSAGGHLYAYLNLFFLEREARIAEVPRYNYCGMRSPGLKRIAMVAKATHNIDISHQASVRSERFCRRTPAMNGSKAASMYPPP